MRDSAGVFCCRLHFKTRRAMNMFQACRTRRTVPAPRACALSNRRRCCVRTAFLNAPNRFRRRRLRLYQVGARAAGKFARCRDPDRRWNRANDGTYDVWVCVYAPRWEPSGLIAPGTNVVQIKDTRGTRLPSTGGEPRYACRCQNRVEPSYFVSTLSILQKACR